MASNDNHTTISAGHFSDWLRQTREAQLKRMDIDVACGDCTACCTSSYFIHVTADEKESLAHIPKELMFPAPGQPKGNMVLGFDDNGHCPMLVDNHCSIYEHRPHSCRSYDCRLFAAVGIPAGDDNKKLINRQAARWQFDSPSLRDYAEQQAVRAAIKFLQSHNNLFPDDFVPNHPTHLALLAIKVYHVFLTACQSDQQRVNDIINELKLFEEKSGH